MSGSNARISNLLANLKDRKIGARPNDRPLQAKDDMSEAGNSSGASEAGNMRVSNLIQNLNLRSVRDGVATPAPAVVPIRVPVHVPTPTPAPTPAPFPSNAAETAAAAATAAAGSFRAQREAVNQEKSVDQVQVRGMQSQWASGVGSHVGLNGGPRNAGSGASVSSYGASSAGGYGASSAGGYVPPPSAGQPATRPRNSGGVGKSLHSTSSMVADGPVPQPLGAAEYYMMAEMESGGDRSIHNEPRRQPAEIGDERHYPSGGILARSADFARTKFHDVQSGAGKAAFKKRATRVVGRSKVGAMLRVSDDNDSRTLDSHSVGTLTIEEQRARAVANVKVREEDVYVLKQRTGYLTILIMLIQCTFFGAIYVTCGLQPYVDNYFFGPPIDALSYWGGMNSYILVSSYTQCFRFWSPVLIHANAINLLVVLAISMLFLEMFEREWGAGKFFIIYIFSAFGASSFSAALQPDVVQVGSLGTICGVFAAKIAEISINSCDKSSFNMDTPEGAAYAEAAAKIRSDHICICSTFFTLMIGAGFIPDSPWASYVGGSYMGIFIAITVFSCKLHRFLCSVFWGLTGLMALVIFSAAMIYYLYFQFQPDAYLGNYCEYFGDGSNDGDCSCVEIW